MGVFAGPTRWWGESNINDGARIFASTKLVVQDGLVLNLDAGASTSYPGSGTTWSDLSGNGNNGTLTNGPTYSSANGGSIVFDGSNDYVTIPSSTDYEFGTDNFTVEFWLHPNVQSTSTIYDSRPLSANGNYFYTGLDSNNNVALQIGGSVVLASSSSCPTGQFTHVAVVRSSGTLKIFINGLQSGSISNSTNFTGSGIASRIGSTVNNTFYFNGYISNLRIYKGKGLTPQEIQQNFNALRARFGI